MYTYTCIYTYSTQMKVKKTITRQNTQMSKISSSSGQTCTYNNDNNSNNDNNNCKKRPNNNNN